MFFLSGRVFLSGRGRARSPDLVEQAQ